MNIRKISYFKNPWIGAFFKITDRFAILPIDVKDSVVRKIETVFPGIEIKKTNIQGFSTIGFFICANANGMVLPDMLMDKEKEIILGIKHEFGLNVYFSRSTYNAFANIISANDKIGIISTRVDKEEINKISDTLGIELIQTDIGPYKTPGSVVLMNNHGFAAHFGIWDDVVDDLSDMLNMRGKKCTVNTGSGFIPIGAICNNSGYLVGIDTTAFEMGALEEALGFI